MNVCNKRNHQIFEHLMVSKTRQIRPNILKSKAQSQKERVSELHFFAEKRVSFFRVFLQYQFSINDLFVSRTFVSFSWIFNDLWRLNEYETCQTNAKISSITLDNLVRVMLDYRSKWKYMPVQTWCHARLPEFTKNSQTMRTIVWPTLAIT